MKKVDVVIIGAGAAGLMCAAQAAKRGRKTLVIEHGKKPGRKILISGGGRCNFTNNDVSANNYLCQNPHFVKSALSQYTNWDFISLIYKYNVDFEERDHGQLFCSDSAKQIVELLLSECELAGVNFLYRSHINQIEKMEVGFNIELDSEVIQCESLVVATGGLSMPKLGATPFGYQLAEQFGLSIIPTTAGLVPFTLHKEQKESFSDLSGIAIPVIVESENSNSFKENILFTHRGLSGPSILQISSYWKAGEKITVNLLPDHDLQQELNVIREAHPNQNVKNALAKFLPKRLIETLLKGTIYSERLLKQLTHKEKDELCALIHQWRILPNGTEGYRTAEVTLGGVNTDELSSKTMESKKVKGLYFVGEVMDVSGWLGGYNFQWAWSSGWVAGQHA